MDDEIKFLIQVKTEAELKGLEKTDAALVKTGDAAKTLKKDIRAASDGKPFDAIAAAAERAAGRVQKAAAVVTTSVQQLGVLTSGTTPQSRGEEVVPYVSGLKPKEQRTPRGTFAPPIAPVVAAPAGPVIVQPSRASESPATGPAAGARGASVGQFAAIGGAFFYGGQLARIITEAEQASEQFRLLEHEGERVQIRFAQGLHFAGLSELPGLVSASIAQVATLEEKLFAITNHRMSGYEWLGEKIVGALGGATKGDHIDALVQQSEHAAKAITQALEKEALLGEETVRIAQLRAEGLNKEADAAERLLKLEQEINGIRARAAQAPGGAEAGKKLEQQARDKAQAVNDGIQKQRQETAQEQIAVAQEALDKAKVAAGGDGPAARLAAIEKERLDTLRKINKEHDAELLTDAESAKLKDLNDAKAKASRDAVGKEQFNTDFNAALAEHEKSPRQKSAERDAVKVAASKRDAQITRDIASEETRQANAHWEKDDEGKPIYVPGLRMSEDDKKAMRAKMNDAVGADKKTKDEPGDAAARRKDLGMDDPKPSGKMVPDDSAFFKKSGGAKKTPAKGKAAGGDQPMSEKDIAGDEPVDASQVDAQPVASAATEAFTGMGAKLVEAVSAALQGVADAAPEVDTSGVVAAISSMKESLRAEFQAQIDNLQSQIENA